MDDFSQADGYGLNKQERLKQERRAAVADSQPPPLDPAFPFQVISFNPIIFGAGEENAAATDRA